MPVFFAYMTNQAQCRITVEIGMEFRFTLLLGEMLEAQALHHLVQRNRVKALHHFQPFAFRQRHGLLFQPLKEITLDATHINRFESGNLILPCIELI